MFTIYKFLDDNVSGLDIIEGAYHSLEVTEEARKLSGTDHVTVNGTHR